MKVLGDGGLPSHDARRWQSGPHLSVSLEQIEVVGKDQRGDAAPVYDA